MNKLKAWAKKVKRQLYVLYFASKDKRVPWYAKLVTLVVVAYAFSPIDLIPDFIPILGYLDDIILVPLGIMLALKLVPNNVLEDCEEKATEFLNTNPPKNWVAGAFIIVLWIALTYWIFLKVAPYFN